jgi:hypothetical protein
MITNRKNRWFVMFVGVLACVLVYGLVRVSGQANNQAYIGQSSCQSVAINWDAVPTAYAPVHAGGNLSLYCPWGSYTWRYPSYLLNDGRDYTFHSAPVSWGDIPKAGSNWNQCLATGYLQYIYNGNTYNKVIEYPSGYDGYLDCELKALPMIMHYGPRYYQMYDPYPGPMEGMVLEQELESDSFILELDNPYP